MPASFPWQYASFVAASPYQAVGIGAQQVVLVTVLGTGLLLTISFLVVLAAISYRRRFWQIEQEKQLEIAKTQHELAEMAMTAVGWELHDELQNPVLAVKLALEYSENKPGTLNPELIRQMINDLGRVNDSLRRIAHRLSANYLEGRSLIQTAQEEAARLTRTGRFEVALTIGDPLPDLSKEQVLLLSRILQEMISNTLKHSLDEDDYTNLVKVSIRIEHADGQLSVSVRDQGKGFDTGEKAGSGFGGIRKKAWLLGARFAVESVPSKGTLIAVWLPIP